MDIFVEQLVKKRRDGKDYLIMILCVVGVLAVLAAFSVFSMTAIGFIAFLVAAALVYVLYMVFTSINLEYEYCFTNGALDVDKIINVRKRKRMTELNARTIELMAPRSHSQYERYLRDQQYKKVYACADRNADDLYFVLYMENENKKMLLFSPNEKIKEGFKRFNPQKVELTA
ncbi:MAG TPA: hypothetical protein H9685_06170 [Firmicutes bacterium]|nr:hypothetical protein [Bacillota bacterium]